MFAVAIVLLSVGMLFPADRGWVLFVRFAGLAGVVLSGALLVFTNDAQIGKDANTDNSHHQRE